MVIHHIYSCYISFLFLFLYFFFILFSIAVKLWQSLSPRSLSLSYSISLSPSLSLSLSLSLTLSLSLSSSLSFFLSHPHSLSFSHSPSLTLTLSLSPSLLLDLPRNVSWWSQQTRWNGEERKRNRSDWSHGEGGEHGFLLFHRIFATVVDIYLILIVFFGIVCLHRDCFTYSKINRRFS